MINSPHCTRKYLTTEEKQIRAITLLASYFDPNVILKTAHLPIFHPLRFNYWWGFEWITNPERILIRYALNGQSYVELTKSQKDAGKNVYVYETLMLDYQKRRNET